MSLEAVAPADLSDDDPLKHPGTMRALWWSRCPSCTALIHGDSRCGCSKPHPDAQHCICGQSHVGDVTGLAVVDGHQVWVCRTCFVASLST